MISGPLKASIESFVSQTFNKLRLYLLGPEHFEGKSIVFAFKNYDPKTTLLSNYLASHANQSSNPGSIDEEVLNKLVDTTSSYIDSLEQKTRADVSRIVSDHLESANRKARLEGKTVSEILQEDAGQEILKNIRRDLLDQKDKLDKASELLVTHELHNSQNMGALDGIIGASQSLGISDPVVFAIGVNDDKKCKECEQLFLMPDGVTPKLYKLSEWGYGKIKSFIPRRPPIHPNCRDVVTTLLPGFGFSDSGQVIYVGPGHDEYSKQRKLISSILP